MSREAETAQRGHLPRDQAAPAGSSPGGEAAVFPSTAYRLPPTAYPVDGHAIVATHLRRVYRKGQRLFRRAGQIVAVDDVTFAVPRGTIFGLLGPNGAGKTTTIKMLSTLLIPTAGTATVGGYDVVRDERLVRRQLGVVLGGDRGLYAKLSARDNLILFG